MDNDRNHFSDHKWRYHSKNNLKYGDLLIFIKVLISGRRNVQHVCQRGFGVRSKALSYAKLSKHESLDEMNKESRVVPLDRYVDALDIFSKIIN